VTVTPTPTITITPTPGVTPEPLNHFVCHQTRKVSVPLLENVLLTDVEFGANMVAVKKITRLCAPASKNGEDPDAPLDEEHLAGYQIKRAKSFPKFERRREIAVMNQLHPGGLLMDVIRPDILLLPTAKSLVGPPGPLADDFNHYNCYKVAKTRFRLEGVMAEDQFFGATGVVPAPLTFKIKKPFRLCIPAVKDVPGEPPTPVVPPLTSLLCYKVKPEPKRLNLAGIFIDNQFGATQTEITHPRELCIPSAIGAHCGNNIAEGPLEQCDGTDSVACPGACVAPGLPNQCTCP
jgi:hypothetical protein